MSQKPSRETHPLASGRSNRLRRRAPGRIRDSDLVTIDLTAGASPAEPEIRVAGRVVLIERRSHRALLQLHDWPHEPHWACPGGGAEGDETPRQAAARELTEETGRHDEPEDELFTWEHEFRFAGEFTRQVETYYLASTDDPSVPLSSPDLDDGIVRREWLSPDKIATLTEPVWPPDLATRLRALQPADG